MNTQKNTVVNLVLTGVFAAITVVLTFISIPMPSGVPITLQTFAVALCGYMLGMKFGTAAIGVYVALGAVGVPVFAGFTGGIGSIVGMTGGFIWGFIPMAFLCGLGCIFKNKFAAAGFGVLGLAVCHVLGVLQFSVVTGTDFIASFLLVSAPYLIKDVVSVAVALALTALLNVTLRKAKLVKT